MPRISSGYKAYQGSSRQTKDIQSGKISTKNTTTPTTTTKTTSSPSKTTSSGRTSTSYKNYSGSSRQTKDIQSGKIKTPTTTIIPPQPKKEPMLINQNLTPLDIIQKKQNPPKTPAPEKTAITINTNPAPLDIIKEKTKNQPPQPYSFQITENILQENPQQYIQRQQNEITTIEQQQKELQQTRDSLNPAQVYILQTDTGIKRMTGVQLQQMYDRDIQQMERYQTDINKQNQTIKKMDPRTNIQTNTKTGNITIQKPDTSFDFTKTVFKKVIDPAYKIPVVGPYVGAKLEMEFGAYSSGLATIKPVIDLATGGKSSQTHFSSAFDFAFEPIGWSPKGSTQILTDRPLFTAGAIGGEILQDYMFAGAINKLRQPASIATRKALNTGGKTLRKVQSVFPENTLFKKTGQKILKTDFGQNILTFTKGGRPATKYTYTPGAKILNKTKNVTDDVVQGVGNKIDTRSITKQFAYGGKGGKTQRVFLSSDELIKSQKIYDNLLGKNTIDLPFPKNLDKSSSVIEMAVTETQYKKSLLGGIQKTQRYTNVERRIGLDFLPKSALPINSNYRSIIKNLQGDDITKQISTKIDDAAGTNKYLQGSSQDWYKYNKQTSTVMSKNTDIIKIGDIGSFEVKATTSTPPTYMIQEGFATQQKAMNKAFQPQWVQKMRNSILKNVDASASLQQPVSRMTKGVKIGSRQSLNYQRLLGLTDDIIKPAAKIITPTTAKIGYLPTRIGTGYLQQNNKKSFYNRTQTPLQNLIQFKNTYNKKLFDSGKGSLNKIKAITELDNATKPISIPKSSTGKATATDTITSSILDSGRIPAFKTKTTPVKTTKTDIITHSRQKTSTLPLLKTPMTPTPNIKTTTIKPPKITTPKPILLPKGPSIRGGGRGYALLEDPRYKFRKFNIGDLKL